MALSLNQNMASSFAPTKSKPLSPVTPEQEAAAKKKRAAIAAGGSTTTPLMGRPMETATGGALTPNDVDTGGGQATPQNQLFPGGAAPVPSPTMQFAGGDLNPDGSPVIPSSNNDDNAFFQVVDDDGATPSPDNPVETTGPGGPLTVAPGGGVDEAGGQVTPQDQLFPGQQGVTTPQGEDGQLGAPEPGTAPVATPEPVPGETEGPTAEPTQAGLRPEDTVEGRMANILQEDSELMQLARTRALQQQSQSGTLNTSMAQTAAQIGVMDRALPIASQDAQTSAAYGMQQAAIEGESRLLAERGEIELQMASADQDTRMALLERQGEIDSELTELRGGIESTLLAERGEIDKQLQTADAETRERLLNRQGEIDTQLQGMRDTLSRDLADQQEDLQLKLQSESADIARQAAIDLARVNAEMAGIEQGYSLERIKHEGFIAGALAKAEYQYDDAMQRLTGAQARQLEKIRGDNDRLIQSSQNASMFYSNVAVALSNILANPDLSETEKQSQVDRINDLLENGLAVIGGSAGVDLGGLLEFGSTVGEGEGGGGSGSGGVDHYRGYQWNGQAWTPPAGTPPPSPDAATPPPPPPPTGNNQPEEGEAWSPEWTPEWTAEWIPDWQPGDTTETPDATTNTGVQRAPIGGLSTGGSAGNPGYSISAGKYNPSTGKYEGAGQAVWVGAGPEPEDGLNQFDQWLESTGTTFKRQG